MGNKIKILNWNIGGAKYLEDKKDERKKTKDKINKGLIRLIEDHDPHVITLQEIVKYGKKEIDNEGNKKISSEDIVDIKNINKNIEKEKQYCYHPFALIDTEKVSSRAKWEKVIKEDGWDKDEKGVEINKDNLYFAQGNSFLIRKDMAHFPVWDVSKSEDGKNRVYGDNHAIEKVHLDTGLYFGDRNTEPRAALVAHFILGPDGIKRMKPLDIFIVNVHLTTLKTEREGIPEIDMEASRLRLAQLDIIFYGIVSRYNTWKQSGYLQRGERREPEDWETFERYQPLWILSGDFNFTPESTEYELIKKMNFMDLILSDNKGKGTKAKGVGNAATLTLDYIFAGPKFISFDPIITEPKLRGNMVIDNNAVRVSDHYPMVAEIPITIPED